MARFQLYFSLNFLRASYFRSSLLLRTEELKFPPAICLIAQVKIFSICLDTILNVLSALFWYLLSHIRKSRPCQPSLKKHKQIIVFTITKKKNVYYLFIAGACFQTEKCGVLWISDLVASVFPRFRPQVLPSCFDWFIVRSGMSASTMIGHSCD